MFFYFSNIFVSLFAYCCEYTYQLENVVLLINGLFEIGVNYMPVKIQIWFFECSHVSCNVIIFDYETRFC